MKNVTLSIDDKVLDRARKLAAERGTSVNRMIREFLEYRPYKDITVFRREIGKYVSTEEVARLEQYTFVPMDINTASDDDLMSIPGLGPRMLREFKEYRPYRNVEQFRREIGKYVDAKEVARLERFIAIR